VLSNNLSKRFYPAADADASARAAVRAYGTGLSAGTNAQPMPWPVALPKHAGPRLAGIRRTALRARSAPTASVIRSRGPEVP
jgi:hypothetical protein